MAKRFFRHGELHLVLLSLCAVGPRHGYELMGELGALFGPRYRPSAGSVYPAVESLAAEGLLEGWDESDRRVYGITPAGEEALERRGAALADLELRTGVHLGHRSELEASLERFVAQVRAVAPGLDSDRLDELLVLAADGIAQAAVVEARVARRSDRTSSSSGGAGSKASDATQDRRSPSSRTDHRRRRTA
jgi:DNA-binding PadR family transcriptional regulator